MTAPVMPMMMTAFAGRVLCKAVVPVRTAPATGMARTFVIQGFVTERSAVLGGLTEAVVVQVSAGFEEMAAGAASMLVSHVRDINHDIS
jgi:hypothetical protein